MRKLTSACLIVCFVVVAATTPATAQVIGTESMGEDAQVVDTETTAADNETAGDSGSKSTIETFQYSGQGRVSGTNESLSLWNDTGHSFTATIVSTGPIDGEVCLSSSLEGSNSSRELVCTRARATAGNETNTTTDTELTVNPWPTNATGQQELSVRYTPTNSSDDDARAAMGVLVFQRQTDFDDDGLSNDREAALETDLRSPDTDDDGLPDGAEVQTHETSPTDPDTDGDGLADGVEVNEHGTEPTNADSDDDGLADGAELEHGTNPTKADTDGDGLDDGTEVNVHGTDPTNPDTDGDGLDDGSEISEYGTNATAPDTDDDNISDALEVNTYETDPNSIDTDGDGLNDWAEVNVHGTEPTIADSDDDGLNDGAEVNTYDTDPRAPDTDEDGLRDGPEVHEYEIMDPNDPDSNGNGVPDGAEVERGPLSRHGGPIAGILGLLVVLLGSSWWLRNAKADLPRPSDSWREAIAERLSVSRTDTEETSADEDDGADGTPAAAADGDDPADLTDVPPEFMSNEQRIIALLEEHDGRIDQSEIVDKTGWSKSKVSRVLSEMEEEGQIVKIDVGAGNVVTDPDEVPPGVQSPLDG